MAVPLALTDVSLPQDGICFREYLYEPWEVDSGELKLLRVTRFLSSMIHLCIDP